MNFVFYVIMFSIQEYSAFESYEESDLKYEDSPKNTGFIKNIVVPTANLKLNVFDKMLSEEMLSIKQHFHDRDSSHTPSVQISMQVVAATPTLEVKQKWPLKNLFLKSWNNKSEALLYDDKQLISQNFTTNGTSTYINKEHCNKNECNSEIKDKVLELRSLPETRAMRICDCMKTNSEVTCTHLCTGLDTKVTNICKHTNKEVKHECTQTTESISSFLTYSVFPIYVTHPPYFWGISTYTENPYYHPNPINEIKVSKTKKRRKIKKPRPHLEDTYQEVIQSNNDRYDNSMENYINSIENYDEDISNSPNYKSSTVYKIASTEYEDEKYKERPFNKLDFENKETFVNNIVEDLKEYYDDIVIKDCYCSLSSRNYMLNIFLFHSIVSTYSLLYL